MSTGHHGTSGDDRDRIDDAIRRLVAQGDGTAKRAYPEGRMGPHDEGELAFAVGIDEKHGTVVIQFNKPVAWMGMGPQDAMRLAAMLIEKARAVATEPLTLSVTSGGA